MPARIYLLEWLEPLGYDAERSSQGSQTYARHACCCVNGCANRGYDPDAGDSRTPIATRRTTAESNLLDD